MFQRKSSRFRRRPNASSFRTHGGSSDNRQRTNRFSNGQSRNKFRPTLSAEKSLEKYNNLAKEALSSGDSTLSENYLQHADHFMRIIEDRNKSRDQSKTSAVEKLPADDKSTAQSSEIKQEDYSMW